MKKAPKFLVRKTITDKGEKYHVCLVAKNGEVLMSSEILDTMESVETNIKSVKKSAAKAKMVIEE